MSSRFLIPVLCVGAVAFACGPRAHNEASTPRQNGLKVAQAASKVEANTQSPSPRKSQSAKSSSVVAAQLYVHASDSAVRLALQVVNTGKKRIEITFPSGQTYDFVILDSVGREVWRWGSGRMFTQALRNKSLGGGESLELEETFKSASLPPGRYTARAVLTSENYPVIQQKEFTVRAQSAVASR